ncbi:drug/metabolite transporter DMT1 [Plasmodium brasilianum]|uniref:Drug/metabolite transporter, putative n=3 Tax=Plasmodium (Plasmodium) TaxID=418103 RepID=A0A1D3TEJ6_PLAMA|nr:drug/metabolite transporter, putative [Plasmodium malariae]KAI4834792.1 drug/metabolite transporter DMT1 [Plasmodium brasilianum]SCP03351.1 drug/metabolite transporter, putative [Plasmodium malariae]
MKFLKAEELFSINEEGKGKGNALLITVNLLLLFSMLLYGVNYILMKYFILINGSIYIFIILRTVLTMPLMIYICISQKSEPKKKKLLHDMNITGQKESTAQGELGLKVENEEFEKTYNNKHKDSNSNDKKKKKKKKKNNNKNNGDESNNLMDSGYGNDKDDKCNDAYETRLNIESAGINYLGRLFKNDEKLIPKIAYMPIIILSVTGAIRQAIVIIALQYTDSHNVAIIQPTIPIFTAILSYYMKIEEMNYITFVSIFLSFFGLAITAEIWNLGTFDFGFLLLLAVPVTKGLQVIYINISTRYVSNDIILFAQMAVLFLITLPFGILGEIFINKNYNVVREIYDLTTNQFLCILYSTIAIIFVCWKIQIIALNHLTPITVSLYQSFQPCFTFILAKLLLNETINYNKYIGTLFIIISLFLYQYGCSKRVKV